MRPLIAGELGKLMLLAGVSAGLVAPAAGQVLNQRLHTIAAQAGGAAVADGSRFVCAHYMVCYSGTLEFYKQEIELAQRHGIQGFALNSGGWLHQGPAHYTPDVERMYEAARQLDSGFKLFLSPDGIGATAIPDMVKRFYDHPNQFRLGEKRVIGSYGGQQVGMTAAIAALRDEGLEVCFVPFLQTPKWSMAWSFESVLDFFLDQPHMDGLHYFAADDSINGILRRNAMGRRVTQKLGKVFMAGVAPAYNSPNLRDFRGMEGYGAIWEGIIRDGADWVELVTWSDYNEDSNLMPYRWRNGQERRYFSRDESYLDATGYYSAWFRTGQQPAITQDKVYLCYRTRSHWLRKEWNPTTGEWEDITMRGYGGAGEGPNRRRTAPDQVHDDVGDFVYITTFLTAPATLTVELAGSSRQFAQAAGIAHAAVELAAGVPRIVLTRDGGTVLDVHGRKRILDAATLTEANAPAGYHLANRTWMSGAAAGPVVARLVAADGVLHGDAVAETVNGRTAIRNLEVDGSGFTLPVSGLETRTYNVRVTYRNATGEEARLTLTADGPPRGDNHYPYYIPLFLPPTDEGAFVTTTFFWSLYASTTHLDVRWRPGLQGRERATVDDDRGSVLIEAIELIAVDPVVDPSPRQVLFPELVAIPGGSFVMGTDTGRPDEGPAHPVTVSPFAIGRYEVTNAEYERFDPGHRRHRDGYSWRDREPVIYVNWFDAVNYCNWLSEQAGLTPSYEIDGRNVTFLPAGEGFRLPSEAEWEYVASGRGEGRRYPWGNDEPVPGVHGNWIGNASLIPDSRLRSDPAAGVMVVGSYPAGASRDGVMDLVGNVCEWGGDWFQPYPSDARTDPQVWDTPSPYRVIRGSSWDYYGYPPEVVDREYNHPAYPGYITIGFRVALPEAGMQKLLE